MGESMECLVIMNELEDREFRLRWNLVKAELKVDGLTRQLAAKNYQMERTTEYVSDLIENEVEDGYTLGILRCILEQLQADISVVGHWHSEQQRQYHD